MFASTEFVRGGLEEVFTHTAGVTDVIIARTVAEFIYCCGNDRPDVAVLEIDATGTSAGHAIADLRQMLPAVRLIGVCTGRQSERKDGELPPVGLDQIVSVRHGVATLLRQLQLDDIHGELEGDLFLQDSSESAPITDRAEAPTLTARRGRRPGARQCRAQNVPDCRSPRSQPEDDREPQTTDLLQTRRSQPNTRRLRRLPEGPNPWFAHVRQSICANPAERVTSPVHVVICDRNQLVREFVGRACREPGMHVVAEVSSVTECLLAASQHQNVIVVLSDPLTDCPIADTVNQIVEQGAKGRCVQRQSIP